MIALGFAPFWVFVFGVGFVACGGHAPIQAARLVALDARTGATRWTARTDASHLEQPTVVGRDVDVWAFYADTSGCSGTERLLVFDGVTGRLLRRAPGEQPAQASTLNGGSDDDLSAHGTHVRMLPYPWRLVGYAKSGRVLWRRRLTSAREGGPYPLASDHRTIYAFSDADHLEALERRTGAVRWQATVAHGPIASANIVVVSSQGKGRVTAFSRAGGKRWSVDVPSGGDLVAPAVSKEGVFIPIQGIAAGRGCES